MLDVPVSRRRQGEKRHAVHHGWWGEGITRRACCFKAMGKQVFLECPAGAGQHTKMGLQPIAISRRSGLSEESPMQNTRGWERKLLASIQGAAGSWQMENLTKDGKRGLCAGFFPQDLSRI